MTSWAAGPLPPPPREKSSLGMCAYARMGRRAAVAAATGDVAVADPVRLSVAAVPESPCPDDGVGG